jgi:hypothetical protein
MYMGEIKTKRVDISTLGEGGAWLDQNTDPCDTAPVPAPLETTTT